MLKEFGSERLIGMLHAFVLLKPILSKSLRDKEEAILKEADLSRFDRLKDFPFLTVDANEVQERMDELHETVDEATTAFNRTLSALQKQIID
jgi:beta-xylosidase